MASRYKTYGNRSRSVPTSKYAFYRRPDGSYAAKIRASNTYLGTVFKLRSGLWQARKDNLNFYSGSVTRNAAAETLWLHSISEKANVDRTLAEILRPDPIEPIRIPLFQHGSFKLASGKESKFKIDCDALSDEEWQTLALMFLEFLPKFGEVSGVPTGGNKLAEILTLHCKKTSSRLLVVDDVWTSGMSMINHIEDHFQGREPVTGAVVFARGPVPFWVLPLFTVRLPG